MSKSKTIRIFNLSAEGSRQAWTKVAQRSRFEQLLAVIVLLLLVVPLFALFLGVGAVVALLAVVTGLILASTAWIRRRLTGPTAESQRENVRVVGPNRES